MKVESLGTGGVKILTPHIFSDHRGFFFEAWSEHDSKALGENLRFVQDNHSESNKGVLRGLHYQIKQTQGKLVRVARGSAFVAAVDMRRSSIQFGETFHAELDDLQHQLLWVPAGFAHGFLALHENTHLLYKCTDFYAPQYERVLQWNDETLNINWPTHRVEALIISDKDTMGQAFCDAQTFE